MFVPPRVGLYEIERRCVEIGDKGKDQKQPCRNGDKTVILTLRGSQGLWPGAKPNP